MCIFGSSSTPAPPPLPPLPPPLPPVVQPPPSPTPVDEEVIRSRQLQRQRAALAGRRASTTSFGVTGLLRPADTAKKTLVGV